MPKKPKFKPGITRVKLNPEQAVLSCNCWTVGSPSGAGWKGLTYPAFCGVIPKRIYTNVVECVGASGNIGYVRDNAPTASS